MVEGKTITLGGREFVLPPIPFGVFRKYKQVFSTGGTIDVDVMADGIFSALKRNYPDITQEDFEDNYLDLGNIRETFRVVMGISGMEEKQPGEANPGS
jgi:hypothetical protein